MLDLFERITKFASTFLPTFSDKIVFPAPNVPLWECSTEY